jgi:hypothetical protein
VLLAVLSLAAKAGGASSTDHTIQVGARLFLGIPLACEVIRVQGAIGIGCVAGLGPASAARTFSRCPTSSVRCST